MSQCPQCYTGTCRRHSLQDDGRSSIKANDPRATLNKMYDLMVGSKLQALEKEKAKKVSNAERTSKSYRAKLDVERERALKKAVRSSKRPRDRSQTSGNGLNPQALAAILSSPSSSSSEGSMKRKKRKKSHEPKRTRKSDKSDRKESKRRKKHRKRENENSDQK
uniref:AlNc14C147G7429 protein n=1 Tax=Albugo laibachii Nc14 TaxID=890382 RepID=F0WLP1_9STRA|nr:AlNc14C147G7429 [Albugo laibachii Nc14]|eukprot:CCA22207.1 AlNc14C147G7429 [Albugo laibachii Nc14]